jgi:hypothetical protein
MSIFAYWGAPVCCLIALMQYIIIPHKCIQHYKMISHSSNIDCLLQTLKSRFVTLTTHYTSGPAAAFADVLRNGS